MKSTLSLPDINWARHSAVLFYVAVAWFRGAFRACKNLSCRRARNCLLLRLCHNSPPTVEWVECMVSQNIRHSGKALQPASRLDRIFVCMFDLYIFICFNVWCVCVPTPLFSIEYPGWAWIIHFLFIFSQHEHDSQGWCRGCSTIKPRKYSPVCVLTDWPLHLMPSHWVMKQFGIYIDTELFQ